MQRFRNRMFLLCVAAAAVAPGISSLEAVAQTNTCNGFVSIAYPPSNSIANERVRIGVSAGQINGGSKLRVNSLTFYLDCRNKGCSNNFFQNCNVDSDCNPGKTCKALGTTCADDGNVVNYVGNITTNCGVTWTATFPNGSNQVVFNASPQLQIPANSPGCSLEFDVTKVASQSNDTTPNQVEQVAGYVNATCDNGSTSSNMQAGFLNVSSQGVLDEQPAPAMAEVGLIATGIGLSLIGGRRLRRRSSNR